MNRRGFLKSLLATAAIATGLAKTRLVHADGSDFYDGIRYALLDEWVSVDEFRTRYIVPAAERLAEVIDEDVLRYGQSACLVENDGDKVTARHVDIWWSE